MDEDDEFLYGTSKDAESSVSSFQPPFNGPPVNSKSDAQADFVEDDYAIGEGNEGQGGAADDDSEEDDDIEFILEPTSRSLDFRQATSRPTPHRTSNTGKSAPNQPSLTTEYTPRERGTIATSKPPPLPLHAQPTPPATTTAQTQSGSVALTSVGSESTVDGSAPDPSTLQPVTAPPSHPSINPSAPGVLDGRSIFDVDISVLAEKPWRRPGSDISDWFNYGFDEISWEAYCYRRRELGEMASVLKVNVLNFSGMPEDQLTAMPMDVRQMVMTGTTAMMAAAAGQNPGAAAAMIAAGVGMNHPMMDMNAAMNMSAAMGMGMNGSGDMGGMPMQPSPSTAATMMQEAAGQGQGGSISGGTGSGGAGTPSEQGVQMGMGADGYVGQGVVQPPTGMMGMGMGGGEFGMQDANAMPQVMYPGMEGNLNPAAAAAAAVGVRGGGAGMYVRGRPPALGPRGRGGYPRGRGRGVMYPESDRPPIPVRSTSPLPPGVPTGPRNLNKYKDRDGNAPAVDGLDYGGAAGKELGRGDTGESDDRAARKRRGSPGGDDGRGPKRR